MRNVIKCTNEIHVILKKYKCKNGDKCSKCGNTELSSDETF